MEVGDKFVPGATHSVRCLSDSISVAKAAIKYFKCALSNMINTDNAKVNVMVKMNNSVLTL